jgi:hypothetical protein
MSISLLMLGNGSVKTLPQTLARIEEFWTFRFLCGPCGMKWKFATSFPQNFLFLLVELKNGLWLGTRFVIHAA